MSLSIGLMSGTSMDGVDAVLLDFAARPDSPPLSVRGHVHQAFDPALRAALMALQQPGANELHRAAQAAHALANAYAAACAELLRRCDVPASAVRAIGAHGQTVRHRPDAAPGEQAYTLQLLNGALLAERSGMAVVCDFRSGDVAAGGQGAPLVPAFHAALFDTPGLPQAVLNLGGIANLTLLDGAGGVAGHDCGPGNVLLDLWCMRHLGQPYDAAGAWAAAGQLDNALFERLIAEPYFRRAPPKSTGRDLFHAAWLDQALASVPPVAAADVQATLLALTVYGVTRELQQHLPHAKRLLVCGGGVRNGALMQRLDEGLPGLHVQATDSVGLPAQQVEAAAFAWLAQAWLDDQCGNRPQVTGARAPRILGALYKAPP